jgi:bla regulator protein BlaR1
MSTLAALANHLWQSTVFAGLVALAILAFRRNRASVRHGLWLAASIKFLIPFAALVSLGAQLAPRVIAPSVQPAIAAAIGTASQPFAIPRIEFPPAVLGDVAPRPASSWPIAPMAASIWLAGSLLFLGVWGVQWRRMAKMVRTGARITSGREVDALRQLERQARLAQPITIVESPGHFEPGVFGIRTPVLLWPAGIGAHLTSEQLVTILAHEVAHVRRRDNLTAAIQMVISSAFWFHPLVWWIGARLADERERACDEDVLHAGGEPEMYAETILAVCRLYLQAPPSCVSGVASSNLRTRIERIMTSAATRTLSWRHKLLLAAVTIAALATPIAIGALTASTLRAPAMRFLQVQIQRRQGGQTADPAQRLTFEISSIKINKSGSGPIAVHAEPGGQFTARNVTLRTLIQLAYRLQPSQIISGPDWMNSDRFDVLAKSDTEAAGEPLMGDGLGQANHMNRLLQGLLADRFKLVVQTETRELPIYALRVSRTDGKLGPDLHVSNSECSQKPGVPEDITKSSAGMLGKAGTPGEAMPCGIRIGPGNLTITSTPLAQFANSLSGVLDRTVVDRTDLAGRYDLSLKWTPDMATSGLAKKAANLPTVTSDGPSIFTAIQEQLGLKLEPTKAPVDVLLIVSAEPPGTN